MIRSCKIRWVRSAASLGVLMLLLAWWVGCQQDIRRIGRERYNAGVAAMAKNDFATAQTELLAARDQAVGDPDLLFRVNYNLGLAYIQEGDRKRADKDPDSNKALAMYDNAIGWLRDAIKLGPTSDDNRAAQQNLTTALAKKAALLDELAKGERKLEARLDAVINSQRQLWSQAQQAWLVVKKGQGQDPLAGQSELTKLANEQRSVSAEAGVVGDLAADEIDAIGKKPEDKRTPEEQVRVIVLKNLDLYLLEARARMAEGRRKFQELASEPAVTKAEASVIALKRAKEQLMDPINVLRAVGQDQIELLRQSQQLAQWQTAQNQVAMPIAVGSAGADSASSPADADQQMAQLPTWFQSVALATRQSSISERIAEVQNRLSTALQAFEKKQVDAAVSVVAPAVPGSIAVDPAAAPPVANEPVDPKQVKLMANVKRALPLVETAVAAMKSSGTALTSSRLVQSNKEQITAIANIARAIEEFSDMRQVIELMHGEQSSVAQLLGADGAQVRAVERGAQTRDGLRKNVERADRLTGLIGEELVAATEKLQAEAAAAAAKMAAPAPVGSAGSGAAAPVDPQAAVATQLTEITKQYEQAQTLRSQIAVLLAQSAKEIESGKDPLATVNQTKAKIAELRRLFFSVIEHLKELITQQGETKDQTVSAASKDEDARTLLVPGLLPRQAEHSAMAQAIAQALASQADALTTQASGGEPGKAASESKKLGEAAAEMKLADTEMVTAKTGLDKALAKSGVSVAFDPMTEAQGKAVEHLQKALVILEPPKQQNPDQQNQDQQDQKDDQGKDDKSDKQDKNNDKSDAGKEPEKQAKQPPPGSSGQQARDKEAERNKKRRDQQSREAPVDKDW